VNLYQELHLRFPRELTRPIDRRQQGADETLSARMAAGGGVTAMTIPASPDHVGPQTSFGCSGVSKPTPCSLLERALHWTSPRRPAARAFGDSGASPGSGWPAGRGRPCSVHGLLTVVREHVRTAFHHLGHISNSEN
jgi:hypothetical protein